MRHVPLAALLALAPLAFAAAHPLDGPRVDLCSLPEGHVGAPVPMYGRFTIADRPDSDHVGRLGFSAIVTILVDGTPAGTGRAWWDGWFWSTVVFGTPGEHTLQAAWGAREPYVALSPLLRVRVADDAPEDGMTLAPACYLAYREAGFVRMWIPLLGTAPAPQDRHWSPVTGGAYVAAPTSCWNDGCFPTLDEQMWGFSAPLWREYDEAGRPRERSAFAGIAGPFLYRAGVPLPYCMPAMWVDAWGHVEGAGLAAKAHDHWTGAEPSKACG